MDELSQCRSLYLHDRGIMENDYGMSASVDFGDDFFNALFYGTLRTFAERVDPTGFCCTSYGEINGTKCYGETHYPRDTAEAARLLANCGLIETAKKIIGFTLNNTPDNQYYIPHVLNRDGSIRANTIQVDTPAHIAIALQRIVELSEPDEQLEQYFVKLSRIIESTFEHHIHKPWNLLNAGNYNEQLDGGSSPVCDLFTNASFVCALKAMSTLSVVFGDLQLADRFDCLRRKLITGIESNLRDDDNVYRIFRDITTGQHSNDINWISLYARRWYDGTEELWDNAFDILKGSTEINWDGMKVISGGWKPYSILGKVFAHLLGYMADTGRFDLLGKHLEFMKNTIRRPINVFPEWWYYKPEENPDEYWIGFWEKYKGIWSSYVEDPQGDYTIDSGNCEQCAVFMNHVIEDLLGVKARNGALELEPKLPFNFTDIQVQNMPVALDKRVSYSLSRAANGIDVQIKRDGKFQTQLKLAVDRKSNISTTDAYIKSGEERGANDIRFMSFELQDAPMSRFKLTW